MATYPELLELGRGFSLEGRRVREDTLAVFKTSKRADFIWVGPGYQTRTRV
jgi:hypothetical protein